MSTIHELIEMLRAELRNCLDRAERGQIRAELAAALAEAGGEIPAQAGSLAPLSARSG
jgi:hypothetical protein